MNDPCPTCTTCALKVSELDRRIDLRFIEFEKRMDERSDLQTNALEKAERVMNTRLEGMNEFRASLRDQASTFVPRSMHDAVIERISKLERWPWLFGIVFAILQIAVVVVVKLL